MNFLRRDIKKIPKIVLVFLLVGLGISFINVADLGLAPWGLFHLAISEQTVLTYGQVTQLVGIIILLITFFFKVYPGIGTILNVILIGFFVDVWTFILFSQYQPDNFVVQMIFLVSGTYLLSLGLILYISFEIGKGPRDGLAILIHSKLPKLSLGKVKFGIEFFVLIIGILIGGKFGIGTILILILSSAFVDINLAILKIDPQKLNHTNIHDYLKKEVIIDETMKK